NITNMITIVDELESMTDDCYKTAVLLKRSIDKEMVFPKEDMQELVPYSDLVHTFLMFIKDNINKRLSDEQLNQALDFENQIDAVRKTLKKKAKKRLEEGANVKTELLYIDIVRTIEKIGDHVFSIAKALAQTR
ncbi:MAG: Na/Pi cotransporter family protein, partial [Spirochaetaceae bacterium]|nr:Na/Pi cotransporter family protein [Spirochaetaceae bacterium]